MTEANAKPRVLFIWPATDELKTYFHEALDDIAVIEFCESRDTGTIARAAANADILVGWAMREEILSAATRARLVVIPAIGVDRHIPILRKFPHLQAVNSRGNAIPTAQHAAALLLAATNYILHFDRHMRDGHWRAFNDSPPSVLLTDITVGILGTGTVACETIRRLTGFGCRILGCSRSGAAIEEFPGIPVYPVTELDTFLKQVNALIVAVPHTPDTAGIISTREINLLPPNAVLVNVARGPVVDESALYEALRDGRLLAAGIDVWYNYRPDPVDGKKYPYTLPFHELDNIVLSPHRASSPLTRPGRYVDVVDNIRRFILGRPLTNVLDLDRGY